MARHRAPRRRGHTPHPPPPPAANSNPPTNPELTVPPWDRLRVVPTPEDVLADPPADPVQLLRPVPEIQLVYGDGHRMRVPIEDGMVISMSCVDGQPRMSVKLHEA